ncbi:MAG: hypothetical protein HYZ31_14070 [Gammaproteobacteria bacterium]|nr:hypothetical protein [Gammaproteobacteria bacterium]
MKTRVRAAVTFIVGAALFSGVASAMGSAISLAMVTLVAAVLFAGYFFSSKPAYELLNEDVSTNNKAKY